MFGDGLDEETSCRIRLVERNGNYITLVTGLFEQKNKIEKFIMKPYVNSA